MVTGASDGIGKALAFELVKRKFKVILIARNYDKLKKVSQEIQRNYKDATLKIIVYDFTETSTSRYVNEIHERLKDLDISIIINNVGHCEN